MILILVYYKVQFIIIKNFLFATAIWMMRFQLHTKSYTSFFDYNKTFDQSAASSLLHPHVDVKDLV